MKNNEKQYENQQYVYKKQNKNKKTIRKPIICIHKYINMNRQCKNNKKTNHMYIYIYIYTYEKTFKSNTKTDYIYIYIYIYI